MNTSISKIAVWALCIISFAACNKSESGLPKDSYGNFSTVLSVMTPATDAVTLKTDELMGVGCLIDGELREQYNGQSKISRFTKLADGKCLVQMGVILYGCPEISRDQFGSLMFVYPKSSLYNTTIDPNEADPIVYMAVPKTQMAAPLDGGRPLESPLMVGVAEPQRGTLPTDASSPCSTLVPAAAVVEFSFVKPQLLGASAVSSVVLRSEKPIVGVMGVNALTGDYFVSKGEYELEFRPEIEQPGYLLVMIPQDLSGEKIEFEVRSAGGKYTKTVQMSDMNISNRKANKLSVDLSDAKPKAEDLSEQESANCYIVSKAGTYTFDASVCGNGLASEGLQVLDKLSPKSAELLWQSEKTMITSVSLDGTTVRFEASGKCGNAVIAVKDESSKIIWSWHIWFPESQVVSVTDYLGNGVMNMNLGAMNSTPADAKSYGLLYQWGRKDPFATASTLTGDTTTVGGPVYDIEGSGVSFRYSSALSTVQDAIENPMVCISSSGKSNDWLKQHEPALWGNPKGYVRSSGVEFPNKGTKSQYDPCPAGYRVPYVGAFSYMTTSGGYTQNFEDTSIRDVNSDGKVDMGDYQYGFTFWVSQSESLYFPSAGRYYGLYGMLYGSVCGLWGNYWTNSPSDENATMGEVSLAFQKYNATTLTCSPLASADRADGYSIRCVRE